jgi:hypothetical protein
VPGMKIQGMSTVFWWGILCPKLQIGGENLFRKLQKNELGGRIPFNFFLVIFERDFPHQFLILDREFPTKMLY